MTDFCVDMIVRDSWWPESTREVTSFDSVPPEIRAAAKALAALDRPDPGGPVNSHAWVIAAGSSKA
jgi:hypothetical protein